MPGEPDPLYVLARRALLDGLAALEPHLASIVVVGAQAVYLHTGSAELAVAELTTDADLVIGPEFLAPTPRIGDLLAGGGFELQNDPGKWRTADGIQVDVLVPEALAGPGRRGARLPGHGKHVARRARGLEGALVDATERDIGSLDPADARVFGVAVAGPAALFVSKMHKIAERIGERNRLVEKDALDVLRLLRAISMDVMVEAMWRLLDSHVAGDVASEALDHTAKLMRNPEAAGSQMAVRATGGLEDPDIVAASLAMLAQDLLLRVRAKG